MCRSGIVLMNVLLLVAASLAKDAQFVTGPRATAKNGRVTLTFAVSAPTDVEGAPNMAAACSSMNSK